MMELFRAEAASQKALLTDGLVALEHDPSSVSLLESLMRAAHSLKGAARIVELHQAVLVAHAMEDCFVAAQKGSVNVRDAATLRRTIDLMLAGVDLLDRLATMPELELAAQGSELDQQIASFTSSVAALMNGAGNAAAPDSTQNISTPPLENASSETQEFTGLKPSPMTEQPGPVVVSPSRDRALRITAENLNRLLALAGEAQVEARRLRPFADTMFRLKRQLAELTQSLDSVRESLGALELDQQTRIRLLATQQKLAESRQYLADRLAELDALDRRAASLTQRLYNQALTCRMRPFVDSTHGLARMVRDLARSLDKEARLQILGGDSPVDRDILDILESLLAQLLRNSVDHGIETPEERHQVGKPPVGTVWIEARHSGGQLLITCGDDGRGIELEKLREAIVRKGLAPAETAERLGEMELFEFLFLPGFTMKQTVTEVSGRGVGLDVVLTLVKAVRGTVRVHSQPGQGTSFEMQLPLTLSVMRALLADIGGVPYAFPLSSIRRTVNVAREAIEHREGRAEILIEGRPAPLVTMRQLFNLSEAAHKGGELPVVVLGARDQCFGVVVDKFLGEQELVVHPLDPRLGKLKDISAGAVLEDGTPALIVDTEDLLRSIEKLLSGGEISVVPARKGDTVMFRRKRVLVADDSLTVRELERKVLESHGYAVELAVDGMDAWNAVRLGQFDLIVTDVDMPRLSGMELVRLVKSDAGLRAVPVMMISYKDREEDRLRGLAAGADYYLAKSRFQEDAFLRAVQELIGEAVD